MSAILYCRRCDLGFCKEHEAEHNHGEEDGRVADIGPWPEGAAEFCCVCTGIYAPPPLTLEEKI
jgi:hypothetical protein